MRIWSYKLVFGLTLFIGGLCHANNYHDHFFSIPFSQGLEEILETETIQTLTLSEAFRDQVNLVPWYFETYWQVPPTTWPSNYKQMSLQRMFNILTSVTSTQTVSAIKTDLFELGRHTLTEDPDLTIRHFDLKMELRNAIIQSLNTRQAVELFRHFLKNEPIGNRRHLQAAMSRSMFLPHQRTKLRSIRRLAQRFGTEIHYYYNIQRHYLTQWVDEPTIIAPSVKKLVEQEVISGFNLNGSADEGWKVQAEAQIPIGKLTDFFLRLFNELTELGVPLQLHMFERVSEGPLYTALDRALAMYRKPLELHIGHSAKLTHWWINRLDTHRRNNPGLELQIQGVPNMYLRSAPDFNIQEYLQRIRYAKSLGMEVREGFDGAGFIQPDDRQLILSNTCRQPFL